MHLKKTLPLLIFIASILISCGPKIVYQKEFEIKNETWTYNDTLSFNFDIIDTNKVYNIWFDITHKEDYPFQNMYMNIYTLFPKKDRAKQQLSIELSDAMGKWLGKHSGDHVNYQLKIQENAFFDKVGKYQITLEQFMRTDSIRGIQKIGIRLEEMKENRKEKTIIKKNK
jgi:gliding motility-associated lipoprotein GldH